MPDHPPTVTTMPIDRPPVSPLARPGIARRLAVAFSLLLALFGTASYFAFAGLSDLHEALHSVEHDAKRMQVALRLESAVRDQYAHMAHTIILGDDSHREMYEESAALVSKTTAQVSARSSDPTTRQLIGRIQKASNQLNAIFAEQLLPAVRRKDVEAPARLHPSVLEIVSDAQSAAEQLATNSGHSIAGFGAHARFVQHESIRWMLSFLIVSLLCAVGVAIYLYRSVARPAAKLAAGAARIGSGDLDTKLEVTNQDELGRLAAQLNAMTVALKEHQARLVQTEKFAGIGRLAAGVAHEINNPLGVILGHVKLLRREDGHPNSRELRIIEEEAERCREVVEDLLDLTRNPPLALAEVSFRSLCEETIERVRSAVPKPDVEVAVRGDATVVGSAQKLRQILHNLLKNAVEAVAPGGHVEVNIATSGSERVTVTIADDGPGVRSTDREYVFEPFFTTKPSGTGLGLAVSRALARAHGGDLALDDAGPGAVFRLTLPLRPKEIQP